MTTETLIAPFWSTLTPLTQPADPVTIAERLADGRLTPGQRYVAQTYFATRFDHQPADTPIEDFTYGWGAWLDGVEGHQLHRIEVAR